MSFNHTENTVSFEKLKNQIQEVFNFAISVDYGIAALKIQLKLYDKGKVDLPRPDYYTSKTTAKQLKNQTHGYKNQLSKYLYLSSFSFFESYLGNVIKEVAELQFDYLDKFEIQTRISNQKLVNLKRSLSGNTNLRHEDRYKSKSNHLREENYLASKDLWFDSSMKLALNKVSNLKANEIPSFLKEYFHLTITEDDIRLFGDYRGLRNDIAHGDEISIGLRKVTEMNNFFKHFAKKIDKHLIAHFVKPKNYREK
jgi:hypothetical protein